jgi:hypothetical protein
MANVIGLQVSLKSSLRLGRETVQFSIGPQMELFTVHKELICSSEYFRNILQPRRRVIVDEDECSICHEAFDPGVKELTHCVSSCGANFHRSCMDEWKRIGTRGPLRCPMCRALWNRPRVELHRLLNIDAEAFEIYSNWLYKSSISVPSDDHTFEDTFHRLMTALEFSVQIRERSFQKAIQDALLPLCAEKACPSLDTVVRTYAITRGSTPMIKLLILLHLELNDQDYSAVLDNWDKYPTKFRMDLTRAMMRERAKGLGTRDLDDLSKKLWGNVWDLEDEEK